MDTQHDDHARMDDDGAPPLRIGIAPARRTFADLKAEQDAANAPDREKYDAIAARQHAEKPKLFVAGQPEAEPAQLIDVRGESLSSLTWAGYLAWRKTKCRPIDRAALFDNFGGWKNEHVL